MPQPNYCPNCDILIRELDKRMDRRFIDLEEKLDERFNTQKDNLRSEAAGLSRRLDGMNEFRQTLTDQAARFIDRNIFDLLKERVEKLERWPWAIAGLFVAAIAVIGIVFKFIIR